MRYSTYSPHPLCSCIAESLPPSTPPGSILCGCSASTPLTFFTLLMLLLMLLLTLPMLLLALLSVNCRESATLSSSHTSDTPLILSAVVLWKACHPPMGRYSACTPPLRSSHGSLCGCTAESLFLITTEAIKPSSHSSSHSRESATLRSSRASNTLLILSAVVLWKACHPPLLVLLMG